jgi:hypothetical protein
VHADESPAWNLPHANFPMQRINHQDGYSIDGACAKGAESYFSRLRRGELGHHHHIAGRYLVRYAQEAAWREDLRRVSNGGQVYGVIALAMRCPTIGRLLRVLATRASRLDQPPTDHPGRLDPRDRLLRPVERSQQVFWIRLRRSLSAGSIALRRMIRSVSSRVVTGWVASRSSS